MRRFLAESYVGSPDGLDASVARARSAAESLRREGVPIRHVRSTLVPEEELCLHIFDAPTATAVGLAGERAALHLARIVEVVEMREQK